MFASIGDRIVIKGHHVGEPERDGKILEVHGTNGAPPYLVRWEDNGHESLFFRAATRPWSTSSGPDADRRHRNPASEHTTAARSPPTELTR